MLWQSTNLLLDKDRGTWVDVLNTGGILCSEWSDRAGSIAAKSSDRLEVCLKLTVCKFQRSLSGMAHLYSGASTRVRACDGEHRVWSHGNLIEKFDSLRHSYDSAADLRAASSSTRLLISNSDKNDAWENDPSERDSSSISRLSPLVYCQSCFSLQFEGLTSTIGPVIPRTLDMMFANIRWCSVRIYP